MAYDDPGIALPSSEIGSHAHFSDAHGRRYRLVVVEGSNRGETSTAKVLYKQLQIGSRIVVDVKLPRMGKVRRVEVARSRGDLDSKRSILLPMQNEHVKITLMLIHLKTSSMRLLILIFMLSCTYLMHL